MVNTRSASKSASVAGATDSTGTEATATTATTSSGDTYTSTGASTDTSNEASSTAAASEVTAPVSATARVPAPAPPAPTPATPKPVKPHTPRRACSNASSKGRRRELLKAKEELLKKQMELAAVRVAMLEEETDDEEEEDDTSTIRGVRMSEWVQQSTLALTMQPHHAVPREDAGATAGLPRRTSKPVHREPHWRTPRRRLHVVSRVPWVPTSREYSCHRTRTRQSRTCTSRRVRCSIATTHDRAPSTTRS
ncbi:formin-binding protein 4-like [Plutella xylostella]|uniref:formin-binding protein 4-like n=1 Tax=Plutella xylostella TaxID=51655 RepID=UPI0020328C48|nr:formin-binding protein 4-like [Plutella xylostella]